ncbi:serine hydrolase domain-containing protein, partial [Streptomyces sp. PTD5-9]|uniref:serine hydrolase domain-containing protein n=1 Tax=Streptomyces sp. PTD5-9 TaxID=3120150 RepID=UPI00300A0671
MMCPGKGGSPPCRNSGRRGPSRCRRRCWDRARRPCPGNHTSRPPPPTFPGSSPRAAPHATLQARRDSPAPYDVFRSTGPGIRRADRFRAGSVTQTFVAVVVLQLAGEGRLRLSGTVDRLPPGLVRGNGHDGRRITLRALLDRNSGLPDHTADGRPVSADAAVRLALTRRPANAPGG